MTALRSATVLFGGLVSLSIFACSSSEPSAPAADTTITEGACLIAGDAPDSASELPCKADFEALASVPVDASLPGARSVKVVLDQAGGDTLYFQNSQKYEIHYDFVSEHLSGGDLPLVPALSSFNASEYYTPDRRFILGAVTHYDGPDVWAFELSPYDTASTAMIEKVYAHIKDSAYFGPGLVFHPTSEALETTATKLSSSVRVKTTDELYEAIDFQPLTLGTAVGRLHFARVADLADEYLAYEDIVVLDEAPNDISVVAGLVTEEFQTPLSHVNVLSQNRGTPNMGLKGALTNPEFVALEGKWVSLTVTSTSYTLREATAEEAAAYQKEHRPDPVTLPALDLSVTDLRDIEDVTPEPEGESLRESIKIAVNAFGGKAAQYSILAKTEGVPIPKAFAVPVFYYDQFMRENGFYDRIDALLADESFENDPGVRDTELAAFRADMEAAPVDEAFQTALKAKLEADYPGETMRFRTSTNSEDLEGFPCAGCYESQTGDPAAWDDVLNAIRTTWASIWLFRTFEERSYYGIDHKSVGMALLVHHNFPDEEANGVATTNNPYDPSGLEPAFYVNVQWGGEAEVVHPPAGVTSDQFLYYFDNPNQPITFISHSNLVPDGENVLTLSQTHELGVALSAIHERFSEAYGPASGNDSWYAMDVEFKFDDRDSPDGVPKLYVKQARPYPGRGDSE
jgi:hypothetical protein